MLFQSVQSFVDNARRIDDLNSLRGLLEEAAARLGLDYFALVYAMPGQQERVDAIRVTNFPADWIRLLVEHGYWIDDPVFAASRVADAGFEWRQMARLLTMTARQCAFMARAARHGLVNGITVPIPKAGSAMSLCSFASSSSRAIGSDSIFAVQSVGWFAFEAARRVAGSGCGMTGLPQLTPRQLDCIVLHARGKSDPVIGQLLGISHRTVGEHIDVAKRKYAVATRPQLLARLLWNGLLDYADILD
jgi:LuxR family quorum-sensing system transcriptional regulator CciR